MTNLLYAVLVHWLIVQYVVEAEITRPIREWAAGTRRVCYADYGLENSPEIPCDPKFYRGRPVKTVKRPKIEYLLKCRLCSGFWVGIAVGVAFGINPLVIAALSHWMFITQRVADRVAK